MNAIMMIYSWLSTTEQTVYSWNFDADNCSFSFYWELLSAIVLVHSHWFTPVNCPGERLYQFYGGWEGRDADNGPVCGWGLVPPLDGTGRPNERIFVTSGRGCFREFQCVWIQSEIGSGHSNMLLIVGRVIDKSIPTSRLEMFRCGPVREAHQNSSRNDSLIWRLSASSAASVGGGVAACVRWISF
jgi:hypothetical protein